MSQGYKVTGDQSLGVWADWSRRFQFTLWPTLFTIPALIFLIGLGNWQLQRLSWKNALIASRVAALTGPAVPAPRDLDQANALDFHRVTAHGRFLHDKELYLVARDDHEAEGFQVVTPFQLDDGAIVLVNRGFVPDSRRDPATRSAGQLVGPVDLVGIIRKGNPPAGWLLPQYRPGEKHESWFYVDLPNMASSAGLTSVLPYYIDADGTPNPGGWPQGGQTKITIPNDHLQYAITWYSFAVILLVIYFIYHYKPPIQGSPS